MIMTIAALRPRTHATKRMANGQPHNEKQKPKTGAEERKHREYSLGTSHAKPDSFIKKPSLTPTRSEERVRAVCLVSNNNYNNAIPSA